MLDTILGSRTRVRILRLLAAHPDREWSAQDVARGLDLSMGSVHPALDQLLDARVVVARRLGRSRALQINRRHPLYPALRATFREETEALRTAARAFAQALPEEGVEAVVLFGSVARGQATLRSDVDVLVLVRDAGLEEEVQAAAASLLDRHDVAITPLVLTSEEVARRLRRLDPLVLAIAEEGELLRGRAEWLGA